MPSATRHTLWSSTLCRNGSSTRRRPAVRIASPSFGSGRVRDRTLLQRPRPCFGRIERNQRCAHVGVEIRVVGVEQEVAADVRLRELLIDAVVAEMEFQVAGGRRREFVVRECIEHPALLRHL